jgi:tetratricopeptide (TPR) repeat protein
MQEKLLGPDHPELFNTLHNLAACYRLQQRYKDAEPLYRRALEVVRLTLGHESPDQTSCMWHYALLLRQTRRKTEAVKLEEEAKRMAAKDPARFTVDFRDLK